MVEIMRSKACEGNWYHDLAEMLLNRELDWASLPHTTHKGAMPFLSVKEMGRLDCSMTNRQERPHLVKAHKDLEMPAFNQHVYTNEEDHRALRWVQERGINLRGFRLELKDSYWRTARESGLMLIKLQRERKSGGVLIGLMNKYSAWHDMEIAKYYATRGKLTNLDAVCWGHTARGHTALTYASSEGHLNIMEALLAAGADKDKSSRSNGYTPLIYAAQRGRVECLRFLLAAGADKDKSDDYGNTPLISSSINGHVECVMELLAVGADVNKANVYDTTPLICASATGHVETVKLLLAAGAKEDKIDTSGKTALTWATKVGHHEIVQLLQQGA